MGVSHGDVDGAGRFSGASDRDRRSRVRGDRPWAVAPKLNRGLAGQVRARDGDAERYRSGVSGVRTDGETVGAAAKVKWSALEVAEVPPAVVTVRSTVPVPAGDVTVMEFAVSAVTVPAVVPNVTVVALAGWCRDR